MSENIQSPLQGSFVDAPGPGVRARPSASRFTPGYSPAVPSGRYDVL